MRKWLVLLTSGLMIVLINLDMTVVNLGLTHIATDFRATLNESQWIIISYLLSTIGFFSVFGKLADNYGNKRIFLVGIFIFTLGSVCCALSTSIEWLILARFIQGFGFAATLGLSIVIIVSHFPPKQAGFATGLGVTLSGLSMAFGPFIGGILLSHCPWPWIFWINLPLGFIAFVGTCFFVNPDHEHCQRSSVSIPNMVLFLVAIFLFISGLNLIAVISWPCMVAVLLASGLLLVLFYRMSLRVTRPLIDVRLLTNRTFVTILSIRLVFMYFMGAVCFILPLYLQNVLDISVFYSGSIMLGMSLFVGIAAPVAGNISDRLGYRLPLLVSSLLAVVSSVALLFFGKEISWALFVVALFPYGLSIGIHLTASTDAALKNAPQESRSQAIGLFFTVAIAGSAIGVAITGAIVNFVSRYYLLKDLLAHHILLAADNFEHLRHVANGLYSIKWYNELYRGSATIASVAHEAFLKGFLVMDAVMLLLMAATLWFSFRLKIPAHHVRKK